MSTVENATRLIRAGEVARAVAELEKAAAAGDPQSCLELGVWLLEGRIVPRDLAASRGWFRRGGELGDTTAERVYISFLANGVGGAEDWEGAYRALQDLAQRDASAERQLALLEAMRPAPGGEGAELAPRKLSERPQAVAFDRLFTADECRYLIEVARPLLEPSVVVDPRTGGFRAHPVRTSDAAFFPWANEDLVINALNRRIARASGTELHAGEPLQVLRYRPGQEYRPHLDALPPGDNQRVLTMLVYLNDDFAGGETLFTRTNLKFRGSLGDALLFRNAEAGGAPDEFARHAGLPVTSGEKFIASRWIRERPFRPS